jgi:probable F420-dependent oxidoreductase
VKVRVGYGLGTGFFEPGAFADLVDALEATGFDSLWLSERLTGEALDPLVGLAVAAGRTRRLKLGTSVLVLPGRNPVMLAKELATLDRLSGGRLLPAVGLGAPEPAEHGAFGVHRRERAAIFDEALPLIRRLWLEDDVHHAGTYFRVDGVSLRPKPVQSPPDVWLGGRAPSELRRIGRLGDGWLPSFCTPAEAEEGRAVVEKAAAEAGRTMDPEHWGALVIYTEGPLPDRLARAMAARRPGTDPASVIGQGLDGLRARLEEFVAHGFSKLVVVPAGVGMARQNAGSGSVDPAADVGRLAEAVLSIEN